MTFCPKGSSPTTGICVALKPEERSSPAKGSAWPFPRWRAGQGEATARQDVSLASVNQGIFPATFLWKTQRPGWESRMKGKIINQVVSAKTPAQKRKSCLRNHGNSNRECIHMPQESWMKGERLERKSTLGLAGSRMYRSPERSPPVSTLGSA